MTCILENCVFYGSCTFPCNTLGVEIPEDCKHYNKKAERIDIADGLFLTKGSDGTWMHVATPNKEIGLCLQNQRFMGADTVLAWAEKQFINNQQN